jgi:hypothetical protein
MRAPHTHQPRRWIAADHRNIGDSIVYRGRSEDGTQHCWVGWTTPRPKEGDLLEANMQSGRVAAFTMMEVEWCHDPDDMWFAKTEVQPADWRAE